jgi:hypothetical protein
LLATTALSALATPVQYTFDFTFAGFTSARNSTGLPDGRPAPYDPVMGSFSFTVDLAGNPFSVDGFVDAMGLSSTTPAFSTSNVHFRVDKVWDGYPYFHYTLFLGRFVPSGNFIPDNYNTVLWGSDDFVLNIYNIDYLNAGSMLIYSTTALPDDAWTTYNGALAVGTPPVIDPGPGPGPGPGNPAPEPGSLALVSLGLLCATRSVRSTRRRAPLPAA